MSNFNIIAQPMSQGVYPGGSVPLSVLVGGGSGSYTYQWLYDGSNIPSASSFVWELDPVTSLPVKVKVVNSF